MSNKKKIYLLIFLILVAAALLFYREKLSKKNMPSGLGQSGTKSTDLSGESENGEADDFFDQIDREFNEKCESGEWVAINDVRENESSSTGILRWVDIGNSEIPKNFQNYDYFLDGAEKVALVSQGAGTEDKSDVLDLFENREVEVQGAARQTSVKEIDVSRIRCTGRETDKNAADSRSKLLNYISDSIGSIAPEKAPYKKWAVDSAVILDTRSIYVDYYDVFQDDENSADDLDTMHRVLVEINPAGENKFDARVIAYYVPGEDDFVLARGADKFANADEESFPLYYFDAEENLWTRE